SGSTKPAVVVALGDGFKLPDDLMAAVETGPFVFSRSSDRMLRALSHYVRYGKLLEQLKTRRPAKPEPFRELPQLAKGAQPEWLGKKAFAAMGIRVPEGGLAKSADEAVAIAKKSG